MKRCASATRRAGKCRPSRRFFGAWTHRVASSQRASSKRREARAVPRISVVITTYNRAKLLQRCLASVFAQTLSDFEVIVVDDASTDGTAELLAGISDSRLVSVRLPQNAGAPAKPRNAGVARARAELVFIFDSDDTMEPICL